MTVTNKPNVNGDLDYWEVGKVCDQLRTCACIFISGYVFLDKKRFNAVRTVIDEIRGPSGPLIVVEFNPKNVIEAQFSESRERFEILIEFLKSVSVLVYEDDDSGETELEQFVRCIPNRLRVSFEKDSKGGARSIDFRESIDGGEWRNYAPAREFWNDGGVDNRSLGKMSRLMVSYSADVLLKPKLLLCSRSPRRFELLAAKYGRSFVYHLHEVSSPEYSEDNLRQFFGEELSESSFASSGEFGDESWVFSSTRTLLEALVGVSCKKLGHAMNLFVAKMDGSADEVRRCERISAAMSSDLIVVLEDKEGGKRILDKPDDCCDPVAVARKYLSEYSGRSIDLWSCTVFLGLENWWTEGEFRNLDQFKEGLIKRMTAISVGDVRDSLCLDLDGEENWISDSIKFPECKGVGITLGLCRSTVVFRSFSSREIEEYAASGEWRTKAGGFAIQGTGSYLIEKVTGSMSNVMGLPMTEIEQVLKDRFGLEPRQIVAS